LPTGQNCHTPCALPVTSTEFAVTFTHPGYLPQTVPVRAAAAPEQAGPFDPPPEPRLLPNPVFAELQPAAPPRPRRAPAVAQSRPKSAPRAAPTAMAPPPPAPAPASASPWPPPPAR
jgi:hypothetical protein